VDKADAPSLGVQDLFDRTSTWGIVVEDKNADLRGDGRGTSTHNTEYTVLGASRDDASSGCDVSGKGGPTLVETVGAERLLADYKGGA
jgi:hypothetical protein